MTAEVLCVGGLADGERVPIEDDRLVHGFKFVARQPLPVRYEPNPCRDEVVRTQVYEVRLFRGRTGWSGEHTEDLFVASPQDWSDYGTLLRLIKAYK